MDEVLHVSWKCPKEVDRCDATEKRPRVEIRSDLDKNEELEIFSSWHLVLVISKRAYLCVRDFFRTFFVDNEIIYYIRAISKRY